MAQVVERRLPAIYDALDSRNNKVGVRPAGVQVQSGPSRDLVQVNTEMLVSVAAGPEADKQCATEATKEPNAPCTQGYSVTENWQG